MKKKCTTAFIKQYILITAIFGSALIPKMGMAASILIYNTGLDNQSYPLAPGSTDSHYAVVSAPAGVEATPFAPYIVDTTGYPAPAWLTNNSTSQWISIRSSYTISTQDPVGLYDYQTTFDLTGLDPASAVITFRFIADNLKYFNHPIFNVNENKNRKKRCRKRRHTVNLFSSSQTRI